KNGAQTLNLDTEIPVSGRSLSQGIASGFLDGVDFLRVAATLGQRRGEEVADKVHPVKVAPAMDCPEIDLGSPRTAMHSHTELRLARGMFGVNGQGTPSDDGCLSMWIRMPNVLNDPGALAIMADYMLSGIGNSLSTIAYGVSLDNTIRIARLASTDWVQCDVIMEHISDGFGYGTAHLFSEEGLLMATASQSVIVRIP
ncbi:MAG: thioesterase family protein, partial [Gammaproteobacteria bacterium]|nr:thioesterase family protein [Gammaproteobacteria bacterium]